MQISLKDASYIGRYLRLGIFEKNYREISIQIGESAEIGAKKHGRYYILFVKKDNKIDKKARVSSFTKDVSAEDLDELIIQVIEMSLFLADTELDMKKVPIISDSKVYDTKQEVPVSFEDDEEQEEYIPKKTNIDGCISEENKTCTTLPPEKDLAIKQEENESFNEESSDNDDLPPVAYQKTIVNGEEHITLGEEDLPPEYEEEIRDTKKSTSIYVSTVKKHSTISKQSYLLQVLGEDDNIREKLNSVISRLIALDKGKVTELYIRGLMALMTEYSNDIEKLARDLNIDERDLILAVYENQFCN